MTRNELTRTGGCFCSAARYVVRGPLRGVVNCHCTMCKRLHGAFGAHSKAKKADFVEQFAGIPSFEGSSEGALEGNHV